MHFYDDHYQGEPVRVAVLLQPVAGVYGLGMATIQVAETLELRQTLARQILLDTLWRQSLLIALIGLVVFVVVQRARCRCAGSAPPWRHGRKTTSAHSTAPPPQPNCNLCCKPPTSTWRA